MDPHVRRIVDAEWLARFGLSPTALDRGEVHVVAAEVGTNEAFSFQLDASCIVVVAADQLDAARSAMSGLDAASAFTPQALRKLVGPDAQVDGPSWHSYVSERQFRGDRDPAVEPVDGAHPELLAFLNDNDIEDWAESGFPLHPGSADRDTTRFWVLRQDGCVVAAGNMTDWRRQPADVGVLTHPSLRGQGLATRVAASMVAEMLPIVEIARYRALASNLPSLAVARSLGFEFHGRNYRARRPTD